MKLFGTDGVRGKAGVDLTAELATGLARAVAVDLTGPAVIGRDTRRSGPMLSAAVGAGFAAAGVDSIDLGIVPVGAVSVLTPALAGGCGVMVSASHNPADDNGIKFFTADGSKLDPDAEAIVEDRYRAAPAETSPEVGHQTALPDAEDRYLNYLRSVAAGTLKGLSVVLDCANGAAFSVAPRFFAALGAEVEAINVESDGARINDGCGAVHPEGLAAAAAGRVGLAFDGDADRCIIVDEDGATCNGDVILAVLAKHLLERGDLPGSKVVTTVMANLGLRLALRDLGIEIVETPVGDRHVTEALRVHGAAIGTEQSGHVVFSGQATGDGLVTGLRVLEAMRDTGSPLRELRRVMTEYPQVLINVPVKQRGALADAPAVWEAVAGAESALGDAGRILVRESGTEPLVRVMVEARAQADADRVARTVAEVVEDRLG
ncbi:MAG: phosphoglucosamine mutase [Acidimicrobiia bacterium]